MARAGLIVIKPQQIFESFIADRERKTLILKGDWGVGKTFAWKKFIESRHITEVAVSYVSLFGLRSVQEVRQQILMNAIPKNRRLFKHLGKVAAPVLGVIKSLPRVKVAFAGTDQIAPLLVRKFLICFDDIERKGKDLSLSSVLGLISVLKEEQDCRIVLILNEGELEKEDLNSLKIYREKVIDREVEYKPSASSNISLIFGPTELAVAQETLSILDINNVRIIKFTHWCAKTFTPFLDSCRPALSERFLRNLTILTCLFHRHGTEIDLKTLSSDFFGRLLRKTDEQTSVADKFLQRAEYIYQDFDAFIIEYLHNGYFDHEGLEQTLEALNERERKSRVEEKLAAVWKAYHSNFRANAFDVVAGFRQFIDEHTLDLKFGELVQICEFVARLGYEAESQKWMGNFMQTQIPQAAVEGLEMFKRYTKDPAILTRLEQMTKERQQEAPLKSTVYRIVAQSGWSPKDISVLNSFSEDDYYKWLKEETDDAIISNLRNFHKIFNSKTSEPDYAEVGRKLESAIRLLADEDVLNKLRAEKLFGILASEPPQEPAGQEA